MTKKQLISFLSGLLISGLISGFVYYLLFLETFDLFGIREITNPESIHAELFFTGLVMTILAAIVVIAALRSKEKYAAIGVGLPNLIGLFLVLKFGVIYFDKSNYYEKFDKEKWSSSEEKPLKMARGLVKEKVLVGQTKDEVIKILGEGQIHRWDSTEYIRYWTEYWYCALGLTFENGKVKNASLWVD